MSLCKETGAKKLYTFSDVRDNNALTYEVAPRGFFCTNAVVDECNQPFK